MVRYDSNRPIEIASKYTSKECFCGTTAYGIVCYHGGGERERDSTVSRLVVVVRLINSVVL